MATVALMAATVAALVLAAVGIRTYFLLTRIQKLVDSEVASTMRALGDTARGAQEALRKLDKGLTSLASSMERVDRLTEHLDPDSMARTMVKPVVAKIVSWISGVRKGLASVRRRKGAEKPIGEGEETEAG